MEREEIKVRDLRPGLRNVNMTLKVVNVGEEKTVFSRSDGSEHRVADAIVGDETGTVYMSLWDNDIDEVREKEGSTIKLKNGYVTVFRNTMRLSKGRYGKIEDSDEEIEEVNESNNVSEKPSFSGGRSYRRRGYRRGY